MPTNRVAVADLLGFPGRVDEKLNRALLEGVYHVGRPLQYLVDPCHGNTRPLERVGGALRRDDREAQVSQTACDIAGRRLVFVRHADECSPSLRQDRTGSGECLAERKSHAGGDSHDLTRRPHLRPQDRIDPRELGERQDTFFDSRVRSLGLVLDPEIVQSSADHELGGDLRERPTGGLGHERHRPRCSRVDLEDVHLPIFDRELDVHQAHDAQLERQGPSLVFNPRHDAGIQGVRGQHTCRIARVYSRFLDVLHHAADDRPASIGNAVDVNFDGMLEKLVDEQCRRTPLVDGCLER